MRHSFIFIGFLLSVLSSFAQDKPLYTVEDILKNRVNLKYAVYGQVQDFVTRQLLSDVKSQIWTTDSVLVFEFKTDKNNRQGNLECAYTLLFPEEGEYILRFSKEGYEDASVPLKAVKIGKRETALQQEPVLLKRLPRERKLGEVTVQATKVKFYVHGDTLVYNADAFQLEEGSMLDALIRQLPGAELKDDGRILVNGKQVESLLLNGEDFFRKDRTVLLDNLPTYMVKNVQVYEKEGRTAQLVGGPIGDKQLVMDVHLKKQYEIGWMGNAEAAGGTDDRYLARLFALRFSTHSRLSFFAGINNLNDRQRPGVGSEWMPSISQGLSTTRNAGVDYLIDDRLHRFKLEGDATVSHNDSHTGEKTTSQSYMQQGDVYGRSRSMGYSHSLEVNTRHDWTFNSKWVNLLVKPDFTYSRRRAKHDSRSLQADNGNLTWDDLDTLFAPDAAPGQLHGIINRTSDRKRSDGHDLAAGMHAQASIRLPHTLDKILVEARGNYTDEQSHEYAHKLYYYTRSDLADDQRDEHGRNAYNIRSAAGKLSYIYWGLGHNWSVRPSYKYSIEHTTLRNRLYRLDFLTDEPSEWPPLGTLPSVTDWMDQAFDPEHSSYSTYRDQSHVVALNIHKETYKSNFLRFDFNLPLSIDHNELDYNRPALVDTTVNRHVLLFRPSLMAERFWVKKVNETGEAIQVQGLKLSYEMGMDAPYIRYLVDVRTDDNPLQVYTGNGNLNVTNQHTWTARFEGNHREKQRSGWAQAQYQLIRDAVAMGYTYDRSTGIYTYRPENVNGNYSLLGKAGYSTPLDKTKHLMLELNTDASYLHSIDLSRESVDENLAKSNVNTTRLTQGIRLNYSIGKVRIGGKSSVTYTHQASPRPEFQPTDAADFHYGLTFVADFPLGWQVSTDATMYSRRGYNDNGMNTDNLVWNMRLAKKLLKGRLSLMLDGFDILDNISTVQRNVNAQGRTETWYRSIPRYAMFHIVYRLSRQPKQQE